jgi:tetratricopeptide (TPR) repeat protein
MDPYFSRAHLIEAAYVEKGMFAEALADNEKMRSRIPPQNYWSTLTFICGRSNQTAQARHALQELLQANRRYGVDPMVIAQAYAGLGDKGQSLAWLEKAYAAHSTELVSLKVSPAYDPLHGDPRFQGLLQRVGLAN